MSSAKHETPADPGAFGIIRNRHDERLDYSCGRGASGRHDIVVIGHGVTANKDREWAVALADALNEAGIASLRLSFAGNGDSEGDFRAATISKEVDDLRSVLDAIGPGWRVTYAGHSMGGAVGVLAASRDDRIRQLISLAGMVHTADFAERKFGALTPGRDVMWDKPECPLSQEFVDDMRAIGTVVELGPRIEIPWLLLHGTADEVVLPRDAHDVRERAASTDCELQELEGVDHVFSGDGAARMARIVVDWLLPRLEPAH